MLSSHPAAVTLTISFYCHLFLLLLALTGGFFTICPTLGFGGAGTAAKNESMRICCLLSFALLRFLHTFSMRTCENLFSLTRKSMSPSWSGLFHWRVTSVVTSWLKKSSLAFL
jgi:hypothetical protein